MADEQPQSTGRKLRADAQRNRERILVAAREEFTRSGADASLDEIAKRAGVGPGTLYRHFSTRDELLQAVYRFQVEKLSASAGRLLQELPPIGALRAWMLLLIDYFATKKLIAPALAASVAFPSEVIEQIRTLPRDAILTLVRRAIEDGSIDQNIDAIDLLHALVGVAYLDDSPDGERRARRLVDILIEGSRPRTGRPLGIERTP